MSAVRNEGAVWQRAPVRSAAVILPLAAVAALLAAKWSLIGSGAGRLGSADGEWLGAACVAAGLTWVCSAVTQQGAVVERLPPGKLLASQFAASTANHVLPAGVGGNAVSLRFLVRRGLSPSRALAALAVRAAAAVTGRLVLLLVALVTFPGALHIRRVVSRRPALPGHPVLLSVGAVAAAAGLFLLLRHARRLGARLRGFVASVVLDVREVHRNRARIAALWGGALAFPLMHGLVVVAVVRAVHAPVPASGAMVAYLCASTATGWLPTPGGLGSLDAALALALVTAGAGGVTATSTVLGYRLLTTWLPLLPGGLVLTLLLRRGDL
ncbi:lysylphosphatidylglycerol synthase domain-containing protein [Actinacidiphila yeochonensis]|uniref:lysylphosphatidylglycerol synthase domain-containing protein n=1 Tax=Actinacidiphila yeochonensis TaxID=89050 RepID=UPI0007C6C759|nr:lysylphosphatidylglycerol synthase domain-containing protein [Actinacidiphila yeochonensis]